MEAPPLTKRQRQILDFLGSFQEEHGMSPTLEEIASEYGVNKVTIFGHVQELQRKGFLNKPQKGISRGLRLVQQGGSSDQDASSQGVARTASVKIVGAIAAGAPIATIEAPEEFALADLIPEGRDVFALRVQGNSMIEDGINDGDIVLVESRNSAHNGETVVAVLPGEEATLKRFYKEKDRIRLQPANETLDPIYVTDLTIRGVVIGVVRRF